MAHTIGGIGGPSSGRSGGAAGTAHYAGPIFTQILTFRSWPRPAPPARLLAWLGFAPPADAACVLPPDLLEPVVEPKLGIDGWTYQGTALEERFPLPVEAELAPLVHGLCRGLGTPYGYERAADLLESQQSYAQAYAVVEAYFARAARPGLDHGPAARAAGPGGPRRSPLTCLGPKDA